MPQKTRQAAGMHLEKPRKSLLDPGTCMDLCQIRDVIVYSSHTRSRRRSCHARGRDSSRSYRIKDAHSQCSNNLQKEQRERFSGQGRVELWSREERPRGETYFRMSLCSLISLFDLFCNSSRRIIAARYKYSFIRFCSIMIFF